ATLPVVVALQEQRRCWMYDGDYYWEDDGLTAEEVKALVLDRERRRRKQVQNAVSRMYMDVAASGPNRPPIPDDVKLFVWSRDGGCCVRCGSQIDLEFDHVIPLAMGGSSSARNLQILCAACNRAKGASLV